ncbi:ABC transporter [Bifidobacterium callitrichos]|nr:ABC transporter [Bifidobacterium callitrichos]
MTTTNDVPAILTRHLTKRYGKARGIEDVNLIVRQGEIFGFIGPNGAGKSTTIRTLLGLIRKTGGEASILGLDCERDRTRILEQVGYLPSEVFYYDGMRARDLLKYAAGFYRTDCSARIKELSARLGLNLDQKVEDMSLGNRKKVGIVQGLMHSPKLIILDEPTSGLDPLVQRAFFDLIREEHARGATVLFSSHILSEVQRICDRVAIIREGRIVAVRSVAEMRRSAVKRVTLGIGGVTGNGVIASGIGTVGAGHREHARDDARDVVAEAKRALAAVPGIRSLTLDAQDGDGRGAGEGAAVTASFLYEGDCNELIAALAGMRLTDVEIAEPTLEEVFMHYYQPESVR